MIEPAVPLAHTRSLPPTPFPGLKAFRQQVRKNARAKGLLGLNKIKGLARHVCLSASSRASRAALNPLQLPPPGPGLLEDVLQQQR